MSDNSQHGMPDGFEEEVMLGGGSVPPKPPKPPVVSAGEHDDGGEHDDKHPGIAPRRAELESIVGPGASDAELVEALLGLPSERLIPWETCAIPSSGFYYGWPTQVVEVRAMGQKAEKILATQRLAQTGQSMDYLFRECVRFPDPSFDPMDLLVGDRVFLLYYLRGITHGNVYEFAMTCPNPQCERTSTHTYDLNDLARTIKHANPSLGEEPFKVTLPYLTHSTGRDFWVGVRFLRGRDTSNMLAMRRTKKRAFAAPSVRAGKEARNPFAQPRDTPIDDTLTENLQMVIVSIMGNQNRGVINHFVSEMHATDTAAIREWLRDNSPGIDSTVTLNCPECGQEFTIELPVTESFFRPTQKR